MSREKAMAQLSPPWYSYQRKVNALFGRDPQVRVRDLHQVDEYNYTLFILVQTEAKAQAIRALLPRIVEISGVTITSRIFIPVDKCEVRLERKGTDAQLINEAFTGNPIFDRVESPKCELRPTWGFCIFKKEVIQFWDDDISNFYGLHTTLAETIALEILRDVDLQFCTGIE